MPASRGPGGRAGIVLGLLLAGALGLLLFGCAPELHHLQGCEPHGARVPVCGFQNPEDLVAAPGGEWLLVSQMASGLSGSDTPGSLIAFRPEDGARAALYPADDAIARSDAGDPACGGPPDPQRFAPHGLDLQGTRLLVVNHGGREAIELFELRQGEDRPALRWTGCVPLPEEMMANDVAGLPDGGLVVSYMLSKGTSPLTILRVLMGWDTGYVLVWSQRTGWSPLPNSNDSAPNGVAVSPDGRVVYYAAWGRAAVVRLARDGSDRREVELDFHPDNLTWGGEGRLLVAGQAGPLTGFLSCAEREEGTCGMPFAVVSIDPDTLAVRPLLREDPPVTMGAASVALERRGELWIGTFAGDRLLRWRPR